MHVRGVASIVGALLIIIGSVFVLSDVRGSTAEPPLAISRVQHAPAPVPEPTPHVTPYPRQAANCPQMTNPGGGIRWEKSADAGPWPTDGAVAIPALGVEAPIVKVGVGMTGEMVVPRNAGDAAWLDQGPYPGQTKNVVLAGHISWNRVRGAFASIGDLEVGDQVVVSMDGKDRTFEVKWNCAFPFNSDFAEQIMGKTLQPSVTLITCGGTFDASRGTHNQRIVVRAELVRA